MSDSISSGERPIGWYVHLPFCHSKCGYCDFYSLPTQPEWIDRLVDSVGREIVDRHPGRPVRSIFVGGGTPTVLPAEALSAVLKVIPRPNDPRVEFTVEANPSSADELKLDLLRSAGVNRVSFGAQSFFPDELAVLERLHDPVHIAEGVHQARRAGFENVNLDLIYGIPGQTVERWLESLARAVDLGVDHIACYSLMYEEGTALTKRRRQGLVNPCDEEREAEMFERTIEVLGRAGYGQYEISNFARPGRECAHNLIYWRNEEYVGVGPSAVSFIEGVRTKNVPDVRRYAEGILAGESVVGERETLSPEDHARETAIQMLRMLDGIGVAAFGRDTGFDPMTLFAEAIERFVASGHLIVADGNIRLSAAGLPVANRVMIEFLAPAPRTVSLM
jgi:oxygen-independent coproporphyrinogen-3 oxidase